jgi:hypothetical protein
MRRKEGAMQGHRDIGDRALTMMQAVAPVDMGGIPLKGPERGIVRSDDALKALAQVFAVVDEALQGGLIDFDRSKHAIRMLMVAREYVCPIPDPTGDEALFRNDLQQTVDELRGSSGL